MQPLGSPFSVHASWLPAGALLIAQLSLSAYNDRSLVASVLLAAATVVGYFLSTLAHALAHIVCARAAGARPGPVRVYVFGDVMVPGRPARTRGGDLATALAGPATSALIAIASGVAWFVTAGRLSNVLGTLALMNLGLVAVNLLPVLPLDAGRLVAARSRTSAHLASLLGRLLGILAVAAGAWFLVQGPTFVRETASGVWLVLVGLFVFLGSGWQDYRASSLPALDDRTVGDWARPFAGRLDAGAPVPASGGPYAVSENGRLAGVLTEAQLREGEAAADVMVPWTHDLGMPMDAPLVRALQRLSDEQTSIVVAVDADGVVRGVLDAGAVREQLERT